MRWLSFERGGVQSFGYLTADNGIVDMFLHLQDKGFTIPNLYKLIKKNNMNLIEFESFSRYKYNYKINGIDYNNISIIKKQTINELFFGDISTHTFYISKIRNTL